jgi:hypothetical protein
MLLDVGYRIQRVWRVACGGVCWMLDAGCWILDDDSSWLIAERSKLKGGWW